MEIAAYQQFADLEETHFWFRGRRAIFRALLDQAVGSRNDLDVLELGCGTGGLLAGLERYGRVHGLELDPAASALCQKRSGVATICATVYAIPLPDHSQDLVCLFDTIEHIPDEKRALAEVWRVMRPGATAFFSVPAYPFLYANNDRVAHHCRRYTRGSLQRLLRGAGFTAQKFTYFNSLLFPAILPAVLLIKLKERFLGLGDPDQTNLTVPIPRALSELLYWVMSSERHLLTRMSIPLGHSLIGIVRKP